MVDTEQEGNAMAVEGLDMSLDQGSVQWREKSASSVTNLIISQDCATEDLRQVGVGGKGKI